VMGVLYQILEDDPLPPRRLQPSIPRDLETICLHCLEKDPKCRYATMQDLADDLRRFQQHEPIRIRPVPVWERGWRWSRKKPAHAALIAIAVVFSVSSVLAVVAGRYREETRLAGLRQQVARLMTDGRQALERDELEAAQTRFQEAWRIVRGEPRLSDHETGVAGWLDHSRNALNRYHWKQRVPPRDFDFRRDEALLLSVLQLPNLSNPVGSARQAIHSALELAPSGDFARQLEREQLVLTDAELIARESGATDAIAFLNATEEFDSRLFHRKRAELLRRLHRDAEADRARDVAEQRPQRSVASRFHAGMDFLREGLFPQSLAEFEAVLSQEPDHFAARVFQSLCFLRLSRPREAVVALTACIAQRPHFHWNSVLRGQARLACEQLDEAIVDFQIALEGRPSESVRRVALAELGLARWRQLQVRQAWDSFVELTERFPQDPEGWILRASSELALGHWTEAVQHFDQAIDLQSDAAGGYFGRAIIRLTYCRFPEACQDFQLAVHQFFSRNRNMIPVRARDAQTAVDAVSDGAHVANRGQSE